MKAPRKIRLIHYLETTTATKTKGKIKTHSTSLNILVVFGYSFNHYNNIYDPNVMLSYAILPIIILSKVIIESCVREIQTFIL